MKFLIAVLVCLFASVFAQNHQSCGLGTNNPGKIVGGTPAANGNWGWQVAMKYNGGFTCGGSLINANWVLTAAHCVYGRSTPSLFSFDAGINSRLTANSWSKLNLRVSKIVMHPSYNPNQITNDIALMKLSTPVTFETVNNRLVPVCVPTVSNNAQGLTGYATGWGSTYSGGSVTTNLNQVALPILSDAACVSYYQGYGYPINTLTQVCAGIAGNNKDTCQGDSGGPLVVRGNDGRWQLVGITSFGFGCGDTGVYTRASGYYNWISTTVASN